MQVVENIVLARMGMITSGAVPAKVLADMLDFHVSTFETYAHLAAGNRGDYPTLRDGSRSGMHPMRGMNRPDARS